MFMHKCWAIHSIIIWVKKYENYLFLVKGEEIAQTIWDTSS